MALAGTVQAMRRQPWALREAGAKAALDAARRVGLSISGPVVEELK